MTHARATTGAESPRIGRAVDAALEELLFHGAMLPRSALRLLTNFCG